MTVIVGRSTGTWEEIRLRVGAVAGAEMMSRSPARECWCHGQRRGRERVRELEQGVVAWRSQIWIQILAPPLPGFTTPSLSFPICETWIKTALFWEDCCDISILLSTAFDT